MSVVYGTMELMRAMHRFNHKLLPSMVFAIDTSARMAAEKYCTTQRHDGDNQLTAQKAQAQINTVPHPLDKPLEYCQVG